MAADRNELLNRLNALLPAQFEEMVFKLGIPVHFLSQGGAQATRGVEVLRYLEQQRRLEELARMLDGAVAVSGGGRGAPSTRGADRGSYRPLEPFRHLSDEQIERVFVAAIAGKLAAEHEALLSGLPQKYVSGLPLAGRADARLLQTLHAMNGVKELADGTVPLAVWLNNACLLTATLPEHAVFFAVLRENVGVPAK